VHFRALAAPPGEERRKMKAFWNDGEFKKSFHKKPFYNWHGFFSLPPA
jgi:hypothetical protein